ncbi:MAG: hypothetical protein ABL958_10925, partial [Bdellovibrionia bacterium]
DIAPHVGPGLYISGFEHYLRHGAREGRQVISDFSERSYLTANKDVYDFIRVNYMGLYSGLQHYLQYGVAEGRRRAP